MIVGCGTAPLQRAPAGVRAATDAVEMLAAEADDFVEIGDGESLPQSVRPRSPAQVLCNWIQ